MPLDKLRGSCMQDSPNDNHEAVITAVTVTYGDRWCYLELLLRRLEAEKLVRDVVVVDNASKSDISSACVTAGFVKPHVIRLEQNSGSAGGYKAGIEAALEFPGTYIMLYDDDVVTTPGSLEHLINSFNHITEKHPSPLLAIMSYRESQHGKLILYNPPLKLADHHFLGLNVFNFFQRHFNKISKLTTTPDVALQNRGVAYAGLLLCKSDIYKIGLPNSDFIVYFDDVEFTSRLLRKGGSIWLDTEAYCEDISDNYSMPVVSLPFIGYLYADSDVKVFYLIRNRIYLDRYSLGVRSIAVKINMLIFIVIMFLSGAILFRFKRLKTIFKAIIDGYNGKLGMHSDYPLT